jgi:hypothetical protein
MHAGHFCRSNGIDTSNKCVCVGAAHKGSMKYSRKLQVVQKTAATLEKRKVLDPFDWPADENEIIQAGLSKR